MREFFRRTKVPTYLFLWVQRTNQRGGYVRVTLFVQDCTRMKKQIESIFS
jgi:hypothetical protein